MAECFNGRSYTVYASNGVGEEMFRAWITLAERMTDDDDRNAVLAFLRNQMDRGDGWRAFDLDPPPAPIASPQRLRRLAKIVADFAVELTRDHPDPSLTEINWDRELQMKWLANMLDFYELIGEAIAGRSDSLDSLEPILSSLKLRDQVNCRLHRLANRKYELKRRPRLALDLGEIKCLLGLIDQELALFAREVARFIANRHSERAELLEDLGDLRGQLAALKMSAAAEPDPEVKLLTEEVIAALEEEIRRSQT